MVGPAPFMRRPHLILVRVCHSYQAIPAAGYALHIRTQILYYKYLLPEPQTGEGGSVMEEIIPKLQEWITFYGLKVLAAIVIFFVGRWIAKAVKRLIEKLMTKKNIEPTLVSFAGNLTYITLLVFVVVAAINQVGVQTTFKIPKH